MWPCVAHLQWSLSITLSFSTSLNAIHPSKPVVGSSSLSYYSSYYCFSNSCEDNACLCYHLTFCETIATLNYKFLRVKDYKMYLGACLAVVPIMEFIITIIGT
jgi:hypothetical protein